jgi:hypothetical protein
MTPSRIARAAVVASSLLLAGGYLIYANIDSLKTSSKRPHIEVPEEDVTPPAERTMSFSSKSGAVTLVPTTQPRSMLGGSKYDRVVDPEKVKALFGDGDVPLQQTPPSTLPATQPATAPATAPATRRTFMGGSKSKQIDLPVQQR